MMRILALFACLALAVAADPEGDAGDESCALQVRQNKSSYNPGQCTICNSCGGDWPASAGRTTYFQNLKTEWDGFGEECSGQLRTRSSDGSVIFSPDICCRSAEAVPYLMQAASETKAVESKDGKKSARSGPTGACAMCDSCQSHSGPHSGPYTFEAGMVSWVGKEGVTGQNYERYEGTCSNYYSTRDVDPTNNGSPSGRVCCMSASNYNTRGMCSLCGGSCGGAFSHDGGYLPYALKSDGEFEVVKFRGLAENCGNSYQTWSANSRSFVPKLCCNS